MSSNVFNPQTIIDGLLATKIQQKFGPKTRGTGLLDFVSSPYAGDLGSSLLAQGGYSTMPTSFGQSLGVAKQVADQNQMNRDATLLNEIGTLSSLSQSFNKDRKIIKGIDGFNYYADTGERVLPNAEKPIKDRKTAIDSQGILRFVDDGTKVFSDDSPNVDRKTALDSFGVLRFIDNGEQVFSGDKPKDKERKTAKDIDGILRYIDNGEKVFSTDTVTKTFNTEKDINNQLRYTEGPNAGKLVFPNVTKNKEAISGKDRYIKTDQGLYDVVEKIIVPGTKADIDAGKRYIKTDLGLFDTETRSIVPNTKTATKRETKADVNGILRYVDDGTIVPGFDVDKTSSFKTEKDINDRLRFVNGPNAGELVFPDVVVEPEEPKLDRSDTYKTIAKEKYGIDLTDTQARFLDESIGENIMYIGEDGIIVNRFEELLKGFQTTDNTTQQTTNDTNQQTTTIKDDDLGSTKLSSLAVDKKVKDLSKEFETRGFTNSLATLDEVKALISPDGKIAGFGVVEGLLPGFAVGSEGKYARSTFATLFNQILKDRSGVAVTTPELDRLRTEFNSGALKTEQDMINALQRYERILNKLIKGTLAGYPQEVVDQYVDQGGIISTGNDLKDKYGLGG